MQKTFTQKRTLDQMFGNKRKEIVEALRQPMAPIHNDEKKLEAAKAQIKVNLDDYGKKKLAEENKKVLPEIIPTHLKDVQVPEKATIKIEHKTNYDDVCILINPNVDCSDKELH